MTTDRIERFLRDEAPPTPFVVVDTAVVAERYEQLDNALGTARIYYAVKANPAVAVIERLAALGSAFDVASPAEIDRCLAAGVPVTDISYGNTIKKRVDIAYAASLGVTRYTIDCQAELDKLIALAPAGSSVCVRLFHDCGGADWPLSRKFGCDAAEASRLLVAAHQAGFATGVSFHVGSQQRDLDAWDITLERVAHVMTAARRRGARPSFVNLGGGFPGRYLESIPPVEDYGRAITTALRRHGLADLELMVEPGRYLVADAGVLRTEVVLVSRRSPDDEARWVYLDCGKFGGLAETMDEAIRYRLRTSRDGGRRGPVVLAGPTCDSADILYDKTSYELPLELTDGDLVDILSAGAYTTTYSSVGFNGFPPLAEHYL